MTTPAYVGCADFVTPHYGDWYNHLLTMTSHVECVAQLEKAGTDLR